MHVESRLQLRGGYASLGGPANTRALRRASLPPPLSDAEAAACQTVAAAVVGKAVTEARWLAMGTADPHGVGDVDRVKLGCAPALRLGSQSMATGAELMQRPLPEANVPPDTAPREPPVHLGGAPTVTAVEQG